MRHRRVVIVDMPLGPSRQNLLERHPCLHPRQRRPETEMQALAEGQMSAAAVDVEGLSVREVALVAVGGTVEQQHHRAFGNLLAPAFGVVGYVPRLYR